MRIASVTIQPDPSAVAFGMDEPKVVRATFTDGTIKDLFSYYSDELHFTEAELVGLTEREARELHYRRDVDWLRS